MEKNKLNFKFNKDSFDLNKIKKFTFEFFLEHSEIVFILFFLIIAWISGSLIYKYMYSSVWDESKKDAYVQELKKENVDFRLNDFNEVVEKIKERASLYEKESYSDVRDIFGIDK